MRQVQPDVWETETEKPFPGLTTHAYLLTRPEGNVLFYNTGHLHELDRMAELGGVSHQFLSHYDEVGASLQTIKDRFGGRLGCHQQEREEVARACPPDILFERRETLLGNIDIIPTPGHSPGSTCFLVNSPLGKRYLFTGDTLYRAGENRWNAGFIPGHTTEKERPVLADSLRLLADLEPDVVFSSAFAGESGYQVMVPGQWRQYVHEAVERLLNTGG